MATHADQELEAQLQLPDTPGSAARYRCQLPTAAPGAARPIRVLHYPVPVSQGM